MPDLTTASLEALLAEVTPGEWSVSLSRSGLPYQIVAPNADDKARGKVGRAVTRWASITLPSSGEGQANARLIAMAPDLARENIDLRRKTVAQAAQIERLWAEVSAWKTAFWTADNFAVAIHDADGKCYSVRAQDYQMMDELFHGRTALQSEVSHG